MGNQKETQKNPQYKYASTREKLCFGIGAIGKDAICNLVGAFLMLYFTDTLYLAPAFVGVLFFVARIWDAINDPMMGMIVDNTHTRFGKFRIWLVIGTLVNSVVFVLLFHSFNLSGTALYSSRKSQKKLAVKKYTHLHADFRLLDLYCSVQQDM